MKIYKTNEEVMADVKDGVLRIDGDVKFQCNVDIKATIDALNINAKNIDAWNINARDINALNIKALNIDALDITYYAICVAYKSITCQTIKGTWEEHAESICIDGELTIKGKQ